MAVTVVRDKCESQLRWAILVLTCLMMIGNYYCYDIPAALHEQMNEYFGKPSDYETMFSLLYTVYSVPNIILPFFGGYFVDKFGSRICLIVFCGFVLVGQFIFAFGLSIKSWPIMLIGRVVFGFGGESLGVANSAILSVWFKGKELAFAFGINLSVARLGSVINNVVSPTLADSLGIQFALWFGVILCMTSIGCALAISFFDSSMDTYLRENKGSHALLQPVEEDDESDAVVRKEAQQNLSKGLIDNAGDEEVEEEERHHSRGRHLSTSSQKAPSPKFKEVFDFKHVYWVVTMICVIVYGCVLPFNNIASALLLERDYFMEPPSGCQLKYGNQCQSGTNVPVDCPGSKWYQPPLPTNITLDGVRYTPLEAGDIDCTDDFWSDGCASEFCDRQTDAELQAGTIMSIPYIISACLSPILGGFVDKFGMRAFIATIAPAMLVVVHSLLGYTDISPVGPLVGQGLAYAGFAAVIWPSLPLIVPARLVGLAYGVAFSIQNAGLASFPLIIAVLYQDNGNEYIPAVETFFVLVAATGVLVGIYLNFYDYMYIDSILNKVGGEPMGDEKESDVNNPMRGSSAEGKTFGEENVTKFASDDEDDEEEEVHERVTSSELYAHLR